MESPASARTLLSVPCDASMNLVWLWEMLVLQLGICSTQPDGTANGTKGRRPPTSPGPCGTGDGQADKEESMEQGGGGEARERGDEEASLFSAGAGSPGTACREREGKEGPALAQPGLACGCPLAHQHGDEEALVSRGAEWGQSGLDQGCGNPRPQGQFQRRGETGGSVPEGDRVAAPAESDKGDT